jgi:hypothetical protein
MAWFGMAGGLVNWIFETKFMRHIFYDRIPTGTLLQQLKDKKEFTSPPAPGSAGTISFASQLDSTFLK